MWIHFIVCSKTQVIMLLNEEINFKQLETCSIYWSVWLRKLLNNYEDDNWDFNSCIILNSGCGIGRSSVTLSKHHPNCAIFGIDRLLSMLNRSAYFLDLKIKSDDNICFDQDQNDSNDDNEYNANTNTSSSSSSSSYFY